MSDRRTGVEYWRSFEQMAGSDTSVKHLESEFPDYDPKEIASLPRRRFLKLMGASMAVAGITATGCRRWPKEELVPSTAGLRDQLPGVPEFYASAIERNGVADSVLVTSYDGRPIKIEGNPLHPMFTTWTKPDGSPLLGAVDLFSQASVLEMYDPARTRSVLDVSKITTGDARSTWDAFLAAFNAAAGRGTVAVLSETSSSLTVADLKAKFLEKYPNAIWAEYEPLTRDSELEAGTAAFKKSARTLYHLNRAKTIVSLDGDLLGTHPNKVRHSADWSTGRRSADTEKSMNRLYIAESCFSITGTAADHRLPIRPSQLPAVALGLAAALGVASVVAPTDLSDAQKAWIAAAAAELRTVGKNGVVAVGLHASAEVQALAYAINFAIGAVGTTVTFHETPAQTKQIESLRILADRIGSGSVSALLILGGNPVYDAPADLAFGGSLGTVGLKAHLSLYADETSKACDWHLPRSHPLESWGDARAWDGTVVLQQPIIQPLYDSKSTIELLALLAGQPQTDGQSHVRRVIGSQLASAANDAGWRKSLHDGFVANSAFPVANLDKPGSISVSAIQSASEFEIRFVPSNQVYDGRYANLGWLQECPDPITKLVWDNAALMNKSDADGLALVTGDLIEITIANHKLEIPVYVLWGQPRGVITLPLGYGRTDAGPIGGDVNNAASATESVGFNAYKVRPSRSMYSVFASVSINKLGSKHDLVTTQDFQQTDKWGTKGEIERLGVKGASGSVIREASLIDYKAKPNFVNSVGHRLPLIQLWDAPYPSVEEAAKIRAKDPGAPTAFNVPHAWGMAVDMSACTGCMACVVACQSENNIPTVGKAMTKMNREMHWIRIDRYFKPPTGPDRKATDYENVDVVYQPMMCQHCETAPCEQVCPVAATVHDTEGLNTMVYNRCIGTRYCSNNCPYKVRRFNYMDWHSRSPRKSRGTELLASAWLGIPDTQQSQSVEHVRRMVYNPEVSVRMRGVMEKCTFCTQRIKAATIKKKADWAKGTIPHGEKPNGQPAFTVDDFEVVTACMQACPTQAITFGNLLDTSSVARQRHDVSRTYTVLEDLNTRARTKYMAKIRNPNEALASAAPAHAAEPAAHG